VRSLFPVAVTLAACAVACAAFGCASTTLGASESHVPVLLGPVPCIGCAPGSAVRVTPATMPAQSVRKDLVCPFCVPVPVTVPIAGTGYVANWEHGTAFKQHADYLGAPACGGALQLTSVVARTWTLAIPPFFWFTNAGIDGDVTAIRAGEGRCPGP
jgi:hypothetical protein